VSVREQSGFALVSVLSVVLILSLLAAGLVVLAGSQARAIVAQEQRIKAIAAADAAIYRALIGLTDRRIAARWSYNAAPGEVEVPAGKATITITDELGRLDINTADDAVLRALFQAAGLAPDEAAALVDRVRDWSDQDDLRRLNGAEAEDYRARGLQSGLRNGPFELVEELKLVKGVTSDLYATIEPALTVYSGRRTVSGRWSSPILIQALELAGNNVPIGNQIAPLPVMESLGGRVFRIASQVSYGREQSVVRQAIVRFTDDPKEPYWIYRWVSAAGPKRQIDGNDSLTLNPD